MYGLDIGALWRNREAARALDLLEYLPATSHYVAAVAQDDELAEQLIDRADKPKASAGPSLTEFSAEVQHLAVVADVLLSIRSLFLQANGAKGIRPPAPLPRPLTAAQRIKRARREDVRTHVMSRLLPGTRGGPPPHPPDGNVDE